MKARVTVLFVMCALPALLGAASCEKPSPSGDSADCEISGTVVDASTTAPIDSALVFLSTIDALFPVRYPRRLVDTTNENGYFSVFPVGCFGLHIVDVEKQGYVSASETIRGGGVLSFSLEPVVP